MFSLLFTAPEEVKAIGKQLPGLQRVGKLHEGAASSKYLHSRKENPSIFVRKEFKVRHPLFYSQLLKVPSFKDRR
jgi:hypothetical protein